MDRLVVQGVSLFRGERLVLRDFSCAVAAGGALLLQGANGAGKSSALRVLAGLARPEAGQILFDGAPDLAGKVAMLGHLEAIKPGLTALDNLAFAARLSGRDARAALADFGLTGLGEVPARLFSAGQKRRLALARLSLSAAPLWLLDEPSVGLDHASVALLGAVLARHRAAGGVMVVATHLPLPLPEASVLELT